MKNNRANTSKKHDHQFEIERVSSNLKSGVVSYLDLACKSCNMKMFVKGKFSWHVGDSDEMVLKDEDLEERK